MKTCTRLLFLLVFFIVLTIYIVIVVKQKINKEEDGILYCNQFELSSYTKDVFINGERINDTFTVVVYNNEIFFSVNMLQKSTSNYFISKHGNTINIRRSRISEDALLQSEDNVFIKLDILKQYIHINNNVFCNNGNIFADTMLPVSVNINGIKYYLTSEFLSSFVTVDNPPYFVLSDGRGVWNKDGDIYIEDDWGNVYKYVESKISIAL